VDDEGYIVCQSKGRYLDTTTGITLDLHITRFPKLKLPRYFDHPISHGVASARDLTKVPWL